MLRLNLESLKSRWAAGEFTEVFEYATAIKNAKAIGQAETITALLELDAEALATEVNRG